MTAAQQKIQEVITQAERDRLFGEIHLRFRDGRLTFITEERTQPFGEEPDRERSARRY